MSRYRFRGKDIETLSREEMLEALEQALGQLERIAPPEHTNDAELPTPIWSPSHDRRTWRSRG